MKIYDYYDFYTRLMANPMPEFLQYMDENNEYLAKLVDKNSAALDIGCGNGRIAKHLSSRVKKVVGIDIDPRMMRLAQENLKGLSNVELIRGDFTEMNLDEKFDLVFASFNMVGSPHFTNEERPDVLRKMLSMTKDNGHLVTDFWSDVGIEFARNFYTATGSRSVEIKDGKLYVADADGIARQNKRWSKEEIEQLASQVSSNFEIVDLAGIFYLLDIKK